MRRVNPRRRMAVISIWVIVINLAFTIPTLYAARSVYSVNPLDDFAPSLRYNDAMGWGLTAGVHTPALTIAVTLVVSLLCLAVCPALTRHYKGGPWALGLITGGALANAMWIPLKHGVPDFLVFRVGEVSIVANPADLAVAIGVVMCLHAAVRLALVLRRSPEAESPIAPSA
jgi:lipoprotein signal peptidase